MTVPSASGIPAAELAAQTSRFFGVDIFFDVSTPGPDGQAKYVVAPAGDLKLTSDREALRQSLMRRMITNPEEWPTLDGYGAGLRRFIKAKNTPSQRAEAEARVRAQALRDPRVASVSVATVTPLEDGSDGVRLSMVVVPVGRLGDSPIAVQLEIR